MKFLTTLQWPLRVWQIFAMAPFGVTNKTLLPVKDNKLFFYAIVWLLLHIVLLILSVVFSSTYLNWSDFPIGNYDTLMAMVTIRLLSVLIVGEAIFKLNKQTEFLQQINRIDIILRHKLRIQIDYKKHQFQCNVLITIWIFVCFSCAICVFVVFHIIEDSFNECFWVLYAFPFLIYSLHYQRMVLYVHAIRLRYQMINRFIEKVCLFQERGIVNNEILQAFKQMSKVAFADCPVEQLISKSQLMDIRNIYQIMYETTNIINDMFWWSLPLSIGIDFHRLLVNSYLVFGVLLFHLKWKDLVIGMFWGLINVAHLILLSHACHSTNKEVRSDEDICETKCRGAENKFDNSTFRP